MIGKLKGIVDSYGEDCIVLDVGSVGEWRSNVHEANDATDGSIETNTAKIFFPIANDDASGHRKCANPPAIDVASLGYDAEDDVMARLKPDPASA